MPLTRARIERLLETARRLPRSKALPDNVIYADELEELCENWLATLALDAVGTTHPKASARKS